MALCALYVQYRKIAHSWQTSTSNIAYIARGVFRRGVWGGTGHAKYQPIIQKYYWLSAQREV